MFRSLYSTNLLQAFEKLLKESPNLLNKLVAVDGDLEQSAVVLKETDRSRLANEVSVVFHFAASLRLEAALGPAVKANTKATQNLLEFSQTLKNLKVTIFFKNIETN